MYMKKEDKELLLKDLSTRLPYGVILKDLDEQKLFLDGVVRCSETDTSRGYILAHEYNVTWSYERKVALCDIKPYLRPMSSMTQEEKDKYNSYFPLLPRDLLTPFMALNLFDWLNANHFDYRGLIEKGLALPAPEGIYNF